MGTSLARIHAAELVGIKARLVEVEVDLHVGLHAFNIVGLADKSVSEAKERVNSALKNSGVKPPNRENRKITVNLAPADIKKTGSHYDLAIAIGYLLATGQIKNFNPHDKIFLGELALDGRLRPIAGALNIAELAAQKNFKTIFVPQENANEAAAISNVHIVAVQNLGEVIEILEERRTEVRTAFRAVKASRTNIPDFSDIKGQESAKRALMIAAAGSHNMLMIGPPGVGKSLLAQALVGILPDLSTDEAIEVTKIYSAAGLTPDGLVQVRPFRSPHQTASLISIVGGGTQPRPGEISLAHRGVLFLDELPEFPKNVLESLRQPIESGVVHVTRARGTLIFPAKFSLITAMNPCPCGFYGDPEKECRCGAFEVLRYQKKISGPLLDRIDLQLRVPRIGLHELRTRSKSGESSDEIKERVEQARLIQAKRFQSQGIRTNAEMSSKQVEELTLLEPQAEDFLKTFGSSQLSPRGYYRLLKTARTIADLADHETVTQAHIAEAFSYRLREEV